MGKRETGWSTRSARQGEPFTRMKQWPQLAARKYSSVIYARKQREARKLSAQRLLRYPEKVEPLEAPRGRRHSGVLHHRSETVEEREHRLPRRHHLAHVCSACSAARAVRAACEIREAAGSAVEHKCCAHCGAATHLPVRKQRECLALQEVRSETSTPASANAFRPAHPSKDPFRGSARLSHASRTPLRTPLGTSWKAAISCKVRRPHPLPSSRIPRKLGAKAAPRASAACVAPLLCKYTSSGPPLPPLPLLALLAAAAAVAAAAVRRTAVACKSCRAGYLRDQQQQFYTPMCQKGTNFANVPVNHNFKEP